ncbi:FecCD family ABC transporter permease [Vreelandella profundi]|uniref:FecCD family ABC transporter permease n=1 Tax=Vreelandella profundi TaxID=2852117 RepID=UPI001EEFC387|nr:iron ABC transporter permease [Halomonas profundi]
MPASSPLAAPLASTYRRFIVTRLLIVAGLAIALAISLLADIASGPAHIPLNDLIALLLDAHAQGPIQQAIVWEIRLPAALMAVLVGAALGLAGAEMQTVLNNPLASPFTLGVGAAATLGASLVIVFNLTLFGLNTHYATALMAFMFAAASMLTINALSRLYGASREIIVLFGIALVFVLNALVALLQLIASPDALQQLVFWTMGSLSRASWDTVAIVAVVLAICMPFSLRSAWAMTALRSGDEHARSFGIAVERLRLISLLRVSLLAAAAVAFVGTIGFIGLVGPHMARLALGEDHRFYLPGSALAGALVLSLASIASKTLVDGLVLPVGLVTSLVGIPFFMALIMLQGRAR